LQKILFLESLPQKFYKNNIEDTSSALNKHCKSIDETPLLFSSQNDSTIKQVKTKDYHITGHFFPEKQSYNSIEPKANNFLTDQFFVFILVLPIILSIWVLKTNFSRIQNAFKAAFNNRFSSIFTRNISVNNHFSTYIIILNSVFSLSLLIWLFLINRGLDTYENKTILLGIILLSVVSYYIYKLIILVFIKYSFEANNNVTQYLFREYYFNAIFSTILPFLNFAIAYSPLSNYLLIISVFTVALLLTYKFLMSLYVGILETGYGLFYFILYFCTVEIVPIAIAVKLVIMYISP